MPCRAPAPSSSEACSLCAWCGWVSGFHTDSAAAVATWCVSVALVVCIDLVVVRHRRPESRRLTACRWQNHGRDRVTVEQLAALYGLSPWLILIAVAAVWDVLGIDTGPHQAHLTISALAQAFRSRRRSLAVGLDARGSRLWRGASTGATTMPPAGACQCSRQLPVCSSRCTDDHRSSPPLAVEPSSGPALLGGGAASRASWSTRRPADPGRVRHGGRPCALSLDFSPVGRYWLALRGYHLFASALQWSRRPSWGATDAVMVCHCSDNVVGSATIQPSEGEPTPPSGYVRRPLRKDPSFEARHGDGSSSPRAFSSNSDSRHRAGSR